MNIVLPFIYILLFTFAITYFVNKPINEMLLLSIIIKTFLVYIGGLVGDIRIGILCSVLIIIVFIVSFIKDYCKKERSEQTKNKLDFFYKNTFNRSLFVIVIFCVIAILITYNRKFNLVDDLSHWGICVKEQFRLFKLYCVDESKLIFHKNYPPFLACLESMWCMLELTFSEPACFRSLLFFEFSIFVSIFNKNTKKKTTTYIFIIISILTGLIIKSSYKDVLYSPGFYNSLYSDWPVALLSGYCLYMIINDDNSLYYYIKLSFCLSALSLIKQVGLIISILLILIFIIKKVINKEKLNIKYLLLLIPFVFYLLWVIYYNNFVFNTQFSLKSINVKEIVATILNQNYTSLQIDAITNFNWNIVNAKIIDGIIKMNFIMSSLTISILIVVGLYLNNRKIKNSIVVSCIYFLLSFVYAYFLRITYLFLFDISEAVVVSCFERYISLYIFMGYSFAIINFLHYFITDEKVNYSIALLVVMVLLINKNSYYTMHYTEPSFSLNDLVVLHREKNLGKILVVDELGTEDYSTLGCRVRYYYLYDDVTAPISDFDIVNVFDLNNIDGFDYVYFCSKKDANKENYKVNTLYKVLSNKLIEYNQ